jgi:hypothetical protein
MLSSVYNTAQSCGQKKKKEQNSKATRQTSVNPNNHYNHYNHYNHRPSSTANHSDINAPSQLQTKTRAATMPKARADKAVMTASRPAIPV